jgi:16S rRNA (cytidine1402-2'-O)-methyltransferase
MAGKLYLCATPIGNLDDITFRVLESLRNADVIAAEDTRHTIKLLNHFDIKTPMTSYHEFNKIDKARILVEDLKAGKNIALVSDAGTPGISDPGEELVKFCHEAGIEVTSIPGPAACITALTMSGLSTRRFCFEGFLPMDKKEREVVLERLKKETRTTVFYEAPHRLEKTLKVFYEAVGNRRISICKELTKRHEKSWLTTLEEAVAWYGENDARGEYVLVIEGIDPKVLEEEKQASWETMSIEDHVALYESKGKTKKEAMQSVASDRGMTKREVYQYLIRND